MVFLWRRIFAYILDVIIISFAVVYPFKKYLVVESINDISVNVVLSYFLVALLTILYFSVFEFYFSQTIGKLFFGIMVKSKIKLRKLGFKQCFFRNISKVSSILYILDLIYLLRNKKQRYLEVKSKTLTVRV